MSLKLSFLGAARNVTGSRYLVEAGDVRFLVDCGLYQEREFRDRNWAPFLVPPATLDGVLLTHAHLDHCGLLPKLVHDGFRGKIYGTPATAKIARIMLMDSAKLQMEDAEFKKKRHEREGRKGPYPEVPLYTTDEAKICCSLFSPARYGEPIELGGGVSVTFYDAGHVLGSAMLKVMVSRNGTSRSVLFSGDVGRWQKPILRDPTLFDEGDYVVVESTYGDRYHGNQGEIASQLAEVINSTLEAGGNIVVPSFALERSQEVLYYLNQLLYKDAIRHMMVFLDSPMAVSLTEVFQHHLELLDKETLEFIRQGNSPFDFPGLSMVRTVDESKAINRISGSVMIIAGSGMCTGGRIKHHLVRNINRPESTVLFVGYQAVGTLGRQIVDGNQEVRILGRQHPVRARIAQISGFSAHADQGELFRWLSGLKKPPRHLFVTHGEPEVANRFADFLRGKTGWAISVPEYKAEIQLD